MPSTIQNQFNELKTLALQMLAVLQGHQKMSKGTTGPLDDLIARTQTILATINETLGRSGQSMTKADLKQFAKILDELGAVRKDLSAINQTSQASQKFSSPSAPPMTQQFDPQNTATTTQRFITPSAPPMTQQFDPQKTATTTQRFATPSAPPMTQQFDLRNASTSHRQSAGHNSDLGELKVHLQNMMRDAVHLGQALRNNAEPGKGLPDEVMQLNMIVNSIRDFESKLAKDKNPNVAEVERKVAEFEKIINPIFTANAKTMQEMKYSVATSPAEMKKHLATLHAAAFNLITELREKTPQGSGYPPVVQEINHFINKLAVLEKDFPKLSEKDQTKAGKLVHEFETAFTKITDSSAKYLANIRNDDASMGRTGPS